MIWTIVKAIYQRIRAVALLFTVLLDNQMNMVQKRQKETGAMARTNAPPTTTVHRSAVAMDTKVI